MNIIDKWIKFYNLICLVEMKDNNTIMQVGISLLLAVITIIATYIIVDIKTKNISEEVVNQMLLVEYKKVGGKVNYDKIIEIQQKQVEEWLKGYDNGWAAWTVDTNQANNVVPSPSWSTLSIEQATKITSEGTYILWNKDAEISFIEYSDLECPFCKKLHESGVIEELLENYDGKVNFIFKQFPLDFHVQAQMEAEATLCVWEIAWEDKYYEFITKVFDGSQANGRSYTKNTISELWATIGIDKSKLLSCIESGKMKQRAQDEMAEWGSVFGITWTPWNVLINNKTGKWDKLPWAYPYASFKAKIDSLLQ